MATGRSWRARRRAPWRARRRDRRPADPGLRGRRWSTASRRRARARCCPRKAAVVTDDGAPVDALDRDAIAVLADEFGLGAHRRDRSNLALLISLPPRRASAKRTRSAADDSAAGRAADVVLRRPPVLARLARVRRDPARVGMRDVVGVAVDHARGREDVLPGTPDSPRRTPSRRWRRPAPGRRCCSPTTCPARSGPDRARTAARTPRHAARRASSSRACA